MTRLTPEWEKAERFTARLITAIGEVTERMGVAYTASVVPTGGNCHAVEISYGIGSILITDGDAQIPTWNEVWIGDYADALDGDSHEIGWFTDMSPTDVAHRVARYLITDPWPLAEQAFPRRNN